MSAGIAKAMAIAMDAHDGQVDKAGKAYILHPLRVASRQATDDGIIVGLLHDVVEDSDYTLDDLRDAGFSDAVIEAVQLLTHERGVDYFDYVRALKGNDLARSVKIQDLLHNADLSRLRIVTNEDKKRAQRYINSLAILMEGQA